MFDTFLKPLARRGALLLGMLCIPVLVWLELWMWVPIPLLALVLLNEFVWWLRGDRAIVVQLSRDSLVVVDRKGQDELSLAVADIQAVNVWYRSHAKGHEVCLALFDGHRVRFAATLHCASDAFVPAPTDIDVCKWEELLGETAGIRAAVAPPEVSVRQHLRGIELLTWCRERFATEAHSRTWARAWLGAAPPLTLFGIHANAPDGMIRCGPGSALHAPDGEALQVPLAIIAHAHRAVTLLEKTADGPQTVEGHIGLAVLATSDTTRLVCPCADVVQSEVVLGPSDLHTHTPEAMALLSHTDYHDRSDGLPPRPKTH